MNVYGSFPVAGSFNFRSQYSVDGLNTTLYQPPGTNTKPVYRQRFFQSGALSLGSHTFVITNLGSSFYLDEVDLVVPSTPAAQSASSIQPPSSAASASQSQVSGSSQPEGATSTDVTTFTTRQASRRLPLGAYIGFGLGGLVVLFCLIGGACLWHHRRKRSPSKPQDISPFGK